MKCQAHNTDGCPECCRAMRAAWTAGRASPQPESGGGQLAGCRDYPAAIRQAGEIIQARHRAVQGGAPGDGEEFWDSAAAQVLGCYLHAAALAGLSVRSLEAWLNNGPAQSTTATEILSMHPRAHGDAAGALRRAADPRTPKTRDASWFVAASAFARAVRAGGEHASPPGSSR